jgi:hypothetical protein
MMPPRLLDGLRGRVCSRTYWFLGLSLVFAAGTALIAILLSATGMELEGGAVAVAGLAPLLVAIDLILTPDLVIGPCGYVALIHVLGYAVGPVGQLYTARVGLLNFDPLGMQPAQWGAFMGLSWFGPSYAVAFTLGSRLSLTRERPTKQDSLRQWDWYGMAFLFLAFSMLALRYVTASTKRVGGNGLQNGSALVVTLANGFAHIHQMVFFFLALSAIRHRSFFRIAIWLGALGAYGAFFFLEGGRGEIVTAVICSALGLGYGGFRRRYIAIGLLVFAVLMVPVMPVVAEYRNYAVYGQAYDKGFVARAQQLWAAGVTYYSGNSRTKDSTLDAVFYGVTAFTVDQVMLRTPQLVPYAGLEDLERARLIWIPRFLSEAKASVQDGNEVAYRYGVGTNDGTSFVYLPSVGEGYRRFGWAGIPLLYIAFGLAFGASIGFAWRRRGRREWAAMLLLLTISAPGAWSYTILTMTYEIGWVLPKYVVVFYVIRLVVDRLLKILFGIETGHPALMKNIEADRESTNAGRARIAPAGLS